MEKMKHFEVEYTDRYISNEDNKKTTYKNHIEKRDNISFQYFDPNQYHLYERIHETRTTDKEKEPDHQTEIYVKNGILYKHYFNWNSEEPDRWEKGKPTKTTLSDALFESPSFLDPSYQLAGLKPNEKQTKLTRTKDTYVLKLTLVNQEQKTSIMGSGKGGKGFISVEAVKKIPLSTIEITIDKETLLIQKIEQHEVSTIISEGTGDIIKKDEYQTHKFGWNGKPIMVPKEALETTHETSF